MYNVNDSASLYINTGATTPGVCVKPRWRKLKFNNYKFRKQFQYHFPRLFPHHKKTVSKTTL